MITAAQHIARLPRDCRSLVSRWRELSPQRQLELTPDLTRALIEIRAAIAKLEEQAQP